MPSRSLSGSELPVFVFPLAVGVNAAVERRKVDARRRDRRRGARRG
jgi:hypothetical protein